MKQELISMQSIQSCYFSETLEIDFIAGASAVEISERMNILKYGFDARTRLALFEWSQHLIKALGETEWEKLGYQFAKGYANLQPHLGLLAINFFDWLKKMPLPESAYLALCRDEAFYYSQNRKFDEINVLKTTQSLIELQITLQKSTIFIEEQNLIISRDREQFYLHQINPKFISLIKKLSTAYDQLETALSEDVEQSEMVAFMIAAVQKKWFKRKSE